MFGDVIHPWHIYISEDLFERANFMVGGKKTKCGTQVGYFEDEFKRLFKGESISKHKAKEKKVKEVQKPTFISSRITKWHSTAGNSYGCF